MLTKTTCSGKLKHTQAKHITLNNIDKKCQKHEINYKEKTICCFCSTVL